MDTQGSKALSFGKRKKYRKSITTKLQKKHDFVDQTKIKTIALNDSSYESIKSSTSENDKEIIHKIMDNYIDNSFNIK